MPLSSSRWKYVSDVCSVTSDIPVTETDTEMIDFSITRTEIDTEKIFNTDTETELKRLLKTLLKLKLK